MPAVHRDERPYSALTYPPREMRLLSLFRFWNVIEYFFPYKHLMDRPWSEVLSEFIPKMESARDSMEYSLCVAELAAQIQDSHGFVRSRVLDDYYGTHIPPLKTRDVDGKTVITYVADSTGQSTGLHAGDIIESVDGEGTSVRRARLGKTYAASTPQARSWRVDMDLLRGKMGSVAVLGIRRHDNSTASVRVLRTSRGFRVKHENEAFCVLPSGIGYIDLTRLTLSQIDTALDVVKATRGLILDVRGYPNGTFFRLAPRLATHSAIAARFCRIERHSPDTNEVLLGAPEYTLYRASGEYDGHIVNEFKLMIPCQEFQRAEKKLRELQFIK